MNQRILVDAHCIGCLAAFAIGYNDLRMNDVATTVTYGFLRQLQSIYNLVGSNNFIFMWDSKNSFRKKLYPEYKAHRRTEQNKYEKDMWISTYEQFHILRNDYLPRLGFQNHLLIDGLEADDLLAKTALVYKNCVIVTTDQDLYQCLPYADIWNPRQKKMVTKETFFKEKGIEATYWGIIKQMVGCVSDNVKGIHRVGEKTAIKFIHNKLKTHIQTYKDIVSDEGKAIIKRNKALVVLPFPKTPLQLLKTNQYNFQEFEKLCDELQMVSLLEGKNLKTWMSIMEAE